MNNKKVFKKLDIIIIGVILVIAILTMSLYYIINNDDTNTVVIYYNNQEIYEFDIESNVRYITVNTGLNSKDTNKAQIEVFDRLNNKIKTKEMTIDCNEAISYKIEVINKKVYVTVSTCENHLCEKMVLSKTLKTPIICTSGIVVKFKTDSLDLISK